MFTSYYIFGVILFVVLRINTVSLWFSCRNIAKLTIVLSLHSSGYIRLFFTDRLWKNPNLQSNVKANKFPRGMIFWHTANQKH